MISQTKREREKKERKRESELLIVFFPLCNWTNVRAKLWAKETICIIVSENNSVWDTDEQYCEFVKRQNCVIQLNLSAKKKYTYKSIFPSLSLCIYLCLSNEKWWCCSVNTAFERRPFKHLYKKRERERASERANESERKREYLSTKESQESDFKHFFTWIFLCERLRVWESIMNYLLLLFYFVFTLFLCF